MITTKRKLLPEPKEYIEQCRVFDWKRLNIDKYPDLEFLNGSMSGVRLEPGVAVKASRAGLVRGKPDIDFPVPRGGYVGLKIELKRQKTGKVSDDQFRWLVAMEKFGWYTCVCHGHQAAINVITDYLDGRIVKDV